MSEKRKFVKAVAKQDAGFPAKPELYTPVDPKDVGLRILKGHEYIVPESLIFNDQLKEHKEAGRECIWKKV